MTTVALLVAGFALTRRQPGLSDRIAPYETGHLAEARVAGADGDDGPKTQVSSSFLQRAVDATEQAAATHGLLEWVEARLDAARLPLRPAEACFFTLAFAVLASVAAGLAKGPLAGIAALVLGVAIPAGLTSYLAVRRRKKFVKQLPEMLQLLSSSMRAGYALMQGVEAVSREISDPMGAELRRVIAESRLGRPVDEALEDAAERMGSPDFAWVVMAISIQRNVGGNLAELLDTVGDTMVARTRLRNEVKALTAEGRVSAMVLGFMPPGLGVAMMVMSPGYLNPLFEQTIGRAMLGGSIVAMIGGFLWMKQIIKIEM
jgi:tight adherence protein B